MKVIELIIISVGLAMDAFAVSVSKGLALRSLHVRQAAWVGLWFGGFQALMPLLGYFIGSRFWKEIQAVDHWVAFVLLAIVGLHMLRDAWPKKAEGVDETTSSVCADPAVQKEPAQADTPAGTEGLSETENADLRPKTMLLLAIATSVDALAVGITFALLKVDLIFAVALIGVITFLLSAAGVYIGHAVGARLKRGATILGGLLLLAIGIKILLEHLSIL